MVLGPGVRIGLAKLSYVLCRHSCLANALQSRSLGEQNSKVLPTTLLVVARWPLKEVFISILTVQNLLENQDHFATFQTSNKNRCLEV